MLKSHISREFNLKININPNNGARRFLKIYVAISSFKVGDCTLMVYLVAHMKIVYFWFGKKTQKTKHGFWGLNFTTLSAKVCQRIWNKHSSTSWISSLLAAGQSQVLAKTLLTTEMYWEGLCFCITTFREFLICSGLKCSL